MIEFLSLWASKVKEESMNAMVIAIAVSEMREVEYVVPQAYSRAKWCWWWIVSGFLLAECQLTKSIKIGFSVRTSPTLITDAAAKATHNNATNKIAFMVPIQIQLQH